jgi:carbon-monoxide dehydrogenase small subunit
MQEIKVNLNGVWKTGRTRPGQTLLDFLRKELFCTEVKRGCERGDCGACTVIMNGELVDSCLVLALQADGAFIITSRGLGTKEKMDPVQKSFYETAGIQCGFCAPGMVLSAKALLEKNKNPSRDEIKRGLSGNLCRCTGYKKIIEAVENAAKLLSEEQK